MSMQITKVGMFESSHETQAIVVCYVFLHRPIIVFYMGVCRRLAVRRLTLHMVDHFVSSNKDYLRHCLSCHERSRSCLFSVMFSRGERGRIPPVTHSEPDSYSSRAFRRISRSSSCNSVRIALILSGCKSAGLEMSV